MSALRVEDLSKAFGGVHAVDGISFEIAAGHVHSIIGPNGAGKTTLFNLMTGIYAPSRGRVFLGDEDVTDLPTALRAARGLQRTFQNLPERNPTNIDNGLFEFP